MKILYITINFPKESQGNNLYTDLAEEIAKKHDITILATDEFKYAKETKLTRERNLEVLRVKIGNIYNVSLIEKGISYVTMQYKIKKAINKYLNNRKYDLIIYTAPPVTLEKAIKYATKKYEAKSYLMQKDIFPQNAIDLGILKKWNPIYWYFLLKEKNIYKVSTVIGCMSQGNIDYIKKQNKNIDHNKLTYFPNTIKLSKIDKNTKNSIRKKYNISNDVVIALYGGNFGKPQGIEFITKVIDKYQNNNKVFFIFVGKGTEKKRLYDYIKENDVKNVITIDYLPQKEYNEILKEVDIGLVFLDYRFTIPNIPSRTLSYFEYSIPIMAATDKSTDYKDILVKQAKAGLWAESNNIDDYVKKFNILLNNKNKRIELGKNGRKYLENNWTVEKSVKLLEMVTEIKEPNNNTSNGGKK